MLATSENIVAFFASKVTFTSVVGDKLFPVFAHVETIKPFAIYRIGEQVGQSKDADKSVVTLSLYFGPSEYIECITFADTCKALIKQEYEWLSSDVTFIEDDQSMVANINFEIT